MRTPVLTMQLRVPLDRFDLDIDCITHQRVLGVFGVSGSGKTTLLESLAGLRRDTSGKIHCGSSVWLDTERGIHLPPEKRDIGYVPQDQRLFPHLNVRQNLLFASRRSTAEAASLQSAFQDIVEVLELQPLLERSVSDLSGGERQRVALGRALCSEPHLLMLDEPLASLDMGLRHRILPFLKRVREHFDVPMLIVSHQPLELQTLCDEVIALREGKIIAQGSPTEVFTNADIYLPSSREGFENILTVRLTSTGKNSSVLNLTDKNAPQLLTYPVKCSVGEKVIMGIPAQDILIAKHRVEGISARNILAAKITALRESDGRVLVFTKIHGAEQESLVAEITTDSLKEMNLEIDQPVFLIIKTSSIRTYEDGRT
ncbi:MAG: molybdenum ABC transporter ATP-binding protein [Chthoniobacterales bacterium]